MQPRISSRIRESVSIVLGMGEVGEPPSTAGAAGGPIAPTGPIGMRRSLRILGLGTPRRTGEAPMLEAPSWRGRLVAVAVLALLVLAVLVLVLE
jgi:hypothetical protein